MDSIDTIFLVFIVITLYFMVLFLLLFFRNRNKVQLTYKPEEPDDFVCKPEDSKDADSGNKANTQQKSIPVTLIVPAHNEEATIGETISAIKNIDYQNLEIIVVDDGSTDKTAEIASKFEGVKVLRKENGGKASALNVGISHAHGEIVGCVDSDSFPTRDSLKIMVPYFEEKGVAAVTSSILVKNPKTIIQKLQEIEYLMICWSRKLLEFLESIYVTPGPLSLYRRDVLLKVGKFDENVMTEDIEITWRLQKHGYKIRMAIPAIVYTKAPLKFKRWWKQRVRWNIGGIQTAKIYKDSFFKRDETIFGMFIVPFFISSFILSIIGMAVVGHLFGTFLIDSVIPTLLSYMGGASIKFSFFALPNMFTFFGILIFLISLMVVYLSLKVMRHMKKNPAVILIYLSIYLFLFPINFLYSCVKFLKGGYEW